jgi:uncharacterized membrane protein
MEAHLLNWLNLLLRWGHFITGVAWIGASFYFNWLENHLERAEKPAGIDGDLWAVHGGGFYFLKKYSVAPRELPDTLHWFKWEAYATWLTGFSLLCVMYYWNARAFLLDPSVAGISETLGITIGLASLALSWIVYDTLCRSRLSARNGWLGLSLFAWFVLLAWILGQLLSGRAAYIHVGAAIGTVMVANVFRVIIPSQKALVNAISEQAAPAASRGAEALQRSRHNNYFTLPVLLIMISSHYPASYGHENSWIILLVISLAGILVRYYFNIRHLRGAPYWPLAAAALLLAGLIVTTAPQGKDESVTAGPAADIGRAWSVIQRRCTDCHAAQPANTSFVSAPLGIELDTMDALRLNAERVYNATVIDRTMPLGNLTQMTEAERVTIASWFENSERKSANEKGITAHEQ